MQSTDGDTSRKNAEDSDDWTSQLLDAAAADALNAAAAAAAVASSAAPAA